MSDKKVDPWHFDYTNPSHCYSEEMRGKIFRGEWPPKGYSVWENISPNAFFFVFVFMWALFLIGSVVTVFSSIQ